MDTVPQLASECLPHQHRERLQLHQHDQLRQAEESHEENQPVLLVGDGALDENVDGQGEDGDQIEEEGSFQNVVPRDQAVVPDCVAAQRIRVLSEEVTYDVEGKGCLHDQVKDEDGTSEVVVKAGEISGEEDGEEGEDDDEEDKNGVALRVVGQDQLAVTVRLLFDLDHLLFQLAH